MSFEFAGGGGDADILGGAAALHHTQRKHWRAEFAHRVAVTDALAVLVAAFGIILIVQGLFGAGPALERWAIRGPFFVLGAVVLFALTIRWGGLLVAGPLAVIMAALGSDETKPTEIAIFAVALTLLSGLLFKELLNLPIPFDPLGLIPNFLSHAYAGGKEGLADFFAALKGALTR